MRWLFRGPAPAADRARTEAEAQRAYRLAIEEGLRERIAELEQMVAERDAKILRVEARIRVLEVVKDTGVWMAKGIRERATLDGPTQVVAQHELRKSWRTKAVPR